MNVYIYVCLCVSVLTFHVHLQVRVYVHEHVHEHVHVHVHSRFTAVLPMPPSKRFETLRESCEKPQLSSAALDNPGGAGKSETTSILCSSLDIPWGVCELALRPYFSELLEG